MHEQKKQQKKERHKRNAMQKRKLIIKVEAPT